MKINYQSQLVQIFNQYNTKSCTSNAISTIISFIITRQGYYSFPVSRLYIYYNTRFLMGQTKMDQGSFPFYALQAIEKFGICPETMWPFIQENVLKKPREECYAFAKQFPFYLHYEKFFLSTDNNWSETFSRHLLNGNLLLCSMKRDHHQKIQEDGNMTSIDNDEYWKHSICCVGIDQEKEIVLFCNSHGIDVEYQGFFSLTFEQMKHLNPIDDEIYVLSGQFLNDKIMDGNIHDAIRDFQSTSFCFMTDFFTIHPNDHVEYSQGIFDHIILGAGITGRYLAHKISSEYPKDSILLIDNSFLSHDFSSIQYHDFGFDSLLCSTASRYDKNGISIRLFQLLNEYNLSLSPSDSFNSKSFDEPRSSTIHSFFQDMKSIWETTFGTLFHENNEHFIFEKIVTRYFLNQETGKTRIQSFLRYHGYDIEYLKKNVFRRPNYYQEKSALSVFIPPILNLVHDDDASQLLRQNMKDLLDIFIRKFKRMSLGDFFYTNDPSLSNIFITETQAIIGSDHVTLIPSNPEKNMVLSSPILVRGKNIYQCFTKNNPTSSSLVNYYEDCDILIYMILENPIEKFEMIQDPNWGDIYYVQDHVIACRDVSIDFYHSFLTSFDIPIKNNMEYPVNQFPLCRKILIETLSSFHVNSLVIYHYNRYIGKHCPLLPNEPNLFHRIVENFSCKSFVHNLDSNLSIFDIFISGSLWLVQEFLDRTKKCIGVFLQDKTNKEFKGDYLSIPGTKLIFLDSRDTFQDCDHFLDCVDMVIFPGQKTMDYEDQLPLCRYLLSRIKEKNERGFYLPLFLFCAGLHILNIIEEQSYDALVTMDIHDQNIQVYPVGSSGDFYNVISDYYIDINLAIDTEKCSKMWNDYILTGVSFTDTDPSLTMIATVQHKIYPIYAFQGHPFLYTDHESRFHQKIKDILFYDQFDHVLPQEIMILEHPWDADPSVHKDLLIQYKNFIPILKQSHERVIGISPTWQSSTEAIFIRNWGFFVDPFTFILSRPSVSFRQKEMHSVKQYVLEKGWRMIELIDGYFEGAADAIYSWDQKTLFLSYGVRTNHKGIQNVMRHVPKNIKIILLYKKNPKWIHLDTCFKPIFDMCFYRPDAFDDKSIDAIHSHFGPRAHPFPYVDCVFGLNFIWTFQYIMISDSVPNEICQYLGDTAKLEVIQIPFHVAEARNGSLYCCTLERPLWKHREIIMASGGSFLFDSLDPTIRVYDHVNLDSIHAPWETFLGHRLNCKEHLELLQLILENDQKNQVGGLSHRILVSTTFIFELENNNERHDPYCKHLTRFVNERWNHPLIIFLGPSHLSNSTLKYPNVYYLDLQFCPKDSFQFYYRLCSLVYKYYHG